MKEMSFVTLVKLYRLAWVAVTLLAAIAFPAHREVMAVIAVVLLVDVLWRAWAMRKIGTSD
jgi:cobalamin synthase